MATIQSMQPRSDSGEHPGAAPILSDVLAEYPLFWPRRWPNRLLRTSGLLSAHSDQFSVGLADNWVSGTEACEKRTAVLWSKSPPR
jgi:hypothetical protein